MKYLRRLSVSLGIVALTACGGDPTSRPSDDRSVSLSKRASPVPEVVSDALPQAAQGDIADVLGVAIRDALGGDWEARYFQARADLNGDGHPEAVVLIAGPMVCGTGGCPVMVLSGDDLTGYQVTAHISVVQPPVQLSTRSANGWRNLVVGIAGGGLAAGNAELSFDGNTYPSNPTVPPAVRIDDAETFEVLIPDFASYLDGRPVPSPPITGRVLGADLHAQDAEELRYRVLQALTARYAERKGIEVSQAEIDAYIARLADGMRQDRAERVAQRDEISVRLGSNELAAVDRGALETEFESLNELIANLDELAEDAATESPEDHEAREEIARAFILQWKLNQALYQEYGGRVIFQQGGPEPLDAYRRLLDESQERGDFAITDKDLEADLWRYYKDDSLHSFYEPGSKEEAAAFDVPWWLAGE